MAAEPAGNQELPLEHPKRSNFRSPAALARFLLTAVVGLTVDLWTKAYSWEALRTTGPWPADSGGRPLVSSNVFEFIPGWLHFKVTINQGAVFGLGQGNRWLFVTVSILAIGFLSYLFATSGRQRFYQFVLGLLLAGVLGNMYDRVRFGYVRDMIYALPDRHMPGTWQVPLLNYPPGPDRELFPWIFNIADVLLCVGVGLMVVYSFFAPREKPESQEAEAPGAGVGPASPTP